MKRAFKLGCGIIAGVVALIFLIGVFSMDYDSGDSTTGTVTTETGEEKEKVEILQTTHDFEEYSESYTLHVRVKNNTDDLISYLQLNATFFDEEGKIVGTGMGNTTNFAGGAEKTVDVIGMDIQNAANYEVQIEQVMYH